MGVAGGTDRKTVALSSVIISIARCNLNKQRAQQHNIKHKKCTQVYEFKASDGEKQGDTVLIP